MKLKTLAVVVALLAALSAVLYWSNRPAAPAAEDPRVGQPLVARAAVEQAAQLRLTDQGKTVVLVRQADGTWRVPTYYDLPVDFSKLSSFISDLIAAKLQRLVTTSPDRIARLEFSGTQIELLDAAGKPTWSVELGKNADTGGRFVRFDGEPKAYLASLNAYLDSEPKNWADAALVTLKPEDIAKVRIPLPDGGAVQVSRANKDAAWTAEPAPPAGQRLSADKISSLLTTLTGVRFSDSSDPADPAAVAAAAHRRAFTLTTFAGKTLTVALGRRPEIKVVKAPDSKPAGPAPGPAAGAGDAKAAVAKPAPEESVTVPAGPVYVSVTDPDPAAPVNALMGKRAFQVDEYVFTGLPQKADDLFEPAPASAPAASAPSPSSKP